MCIMNIITVNNSRCHALLPRFGGDPHSLELVALVKVAWHLHGDSPSQCGSVQRHQTVDAGVAWLGQLAVTDGE